ncbi:MAG TPA: lipoyl(octanoyl) transferase LipB [Nitrososphaerales archaeon]|nr:lipoyl(octanoyl) transferase LipB [Nitrososphaerales archaeon]
MLTEPNPSDLKIDDLDVIDLGFALDFRAVWDLQKSILQKRIANEVRDTLILVEHDHVITLGRSSHVENVLTKDLPIFEIERGGDVTYHGPGQLVAYPIFSLEKRSLGVRKYIELLESAIVRTLEEYGLKNAAGKLGKETGVWVGPKKIASIGVAVSHWITYHGMALNVSTDLKYFQKINPCGFDSSIMTSVSKETGRTISVLDIKKSFLESFRKTFLTEPEHSID